MRECTAKRFGHRLESARIACPQCNPKSRKAPTPGPFSDQWGLSEDNLHAKQIPVNESVMVALQALREKGMQPVVVGGYVRDHLLGTNSKDIDVEVYGATSVEDLINNLPGKTDHVGKSFGVIKAVIDDQEVDFSLPRKESKTGEGHRGFDITVDPTLTVTEAASRRDLTINSMAYDPFTETIIDPYDGLSDLNNGVLRAVSDKFSEDPLRVLRLAGFAGRYDFIADDDTIKICQSLVPEKKNLSKERVRGEVEKIFNKSENYLTASEHLVDSDYYDLLGDNADKETPLIQRAVDLYPVGDKRRTSIGVNSLFVNNRGFKRNWLLSGEAKKGAAFHDEFHSNWASVSDLRKADRRCRKAGISLDEVAHLRNEGMKGYRTDNFEKPLVNGDDLMELGLQPGKHFAKLLRDTTDAQDEGRFNSREEALRFAEALAKSSSDSRT